MVYDSAACFIVHDDVLIGGRAALKSRGMGSFFFCRPRYDTTPGLCLELELPDEVYTLRGAYHDKTKANCALSLLREGMHIYIGHAAGESCVHFLQTEPTYG